MRLAALTVVMGLVTTTTSTPAALACSICGCGDPLLAASDPAAITGTLRLQLDTEYLRIDAGAEGQPGYTDQLTQWSYRMNAVYRPISRLSFMVTAPIVAKAIRTVGPGVSEASSDLVGFGDLELGARYAFWRTIDFANQRVQEAALSLGSMLPTGATDARTTDETGAPVPIDPHGQLGTGGWGPFAGVHHRFEQGDWLTFADVSYRIRTTGTYFDGSKYKFGDAVLWSLHAQYRPIAAVAVDLGIDGRHAREDRSTNSEGRAETVANTGGTVWSAAPGVYVNPAGAVWVFARSQIPFYKNLYGEQDVKPSLTVGLQYQAL